MTQISISELKVNAGKYVKMASDQDIIITKNGKPVARLTTTASKPDKVAAAKALFGLLKGGMDLETAREERLK